MNENLNILFLGDIVGRPGRDAVAKFLERSGSKYDFVIANVENASHGSGLTEKNYNDISGMSVDAMTSGNHIWDRKEIFSYIDNAEKLLRPLNYPKETQGTGVKLFKLSENVSIGIINIQGTVFMSPIQPPWPLLEEEINNLKSQTPIIIIDFHAEATAEKISCGYIADELGVSAILGTHTHVQTADERILKNGAAYITDAGFCGAYTSVIGMDVTNSVKRLTTSLPIKFDVASDDKAQINGVEMIINSKTGKASEIKRIYEVINQSS